MGRTKTIDRGRRFNALFSEEEREMLQALADRDGVSASDFVRLFVRRAYSEAFGSKKSRRAST